jgi:hypothetical protein
LEGSQAITGATATLRQPVRGGVRSDTVNLSEGRLTRGAEVARLSSSNVVELDAAGDHGSSSNRV